MTTTTYRTGSLVLRAETDAERWDERVTAHPQGTPFHLSGFLTTAARVLGLRAELLVAEADGVTLGGVPVLVRSAGPFLLLNHRLPFPYLGPLLPHDWPLTDVLDALRSHFRPRPVVSFGGQWSEPVTVPDEPGWQSLPGYGSEVVRIAGRDDDALLALLSKSVQTTLRRATRAGAEAGPATRAEIAAHLTGWSNLPFARQGLPPRWPAGAHLAFHDALAPSGVLRATAVRRGGEVLAVSADLLLGDRLVAWEIGVGDEGRKANAATVLSFHLMREARERGVAEVDFLGAATPGQAEFKRRFGTAFRPRGAARWDSPLLHLGKRLRPLAQRAPMRGTR